MDLATALEQLSQDKLGSITLPLFFVAILIEALLSRQRHLDLYQLPDFLVSMAMLVISVVIDLLPKLLAFIAFVYLHELSPLKDVVERQWWAWLLLFFLDDFIYYWFHRANHEVRFFWAGHVPHHSSVKLNLGTALRQGIGERTHKYLFWLPLPLLGFDALMIVTVISLNLFYQFWVHTELVRKLPAWIEWLFNTPSHHRVHHGSNVRYLDCNHGGVLIIWDRLFGTFAEEQDSEPVRYGLTQNLETYNPAKVAFGEYANLFADVIRAKRLTDKIRYLVLAPGWSHDGPDKRARVMRAAAG
jgi:sterol desaturase/sphingolipid hydroxylase (fatty acid hydroxylase superfamily)